MILHNFEQKTSEWYEIRIGKVTGTDFKKVFGKNWLDYADQIAAEQITGESDSDNEDGFVSFDMQRGIDLEPLARAEYEKRHNVSIDRYGFIQSSEFHDLGYSPDGVGQFVRFGIEIKCPRPKTHIRYIRHDKIPTVYFEQILLAFIVCDTIQYVDFVSYCPDLAVRPYFEKRVTREELTEEIQHAKEQLTKFFKQVESIKSLLNYENATN
jgi:hypothetical protein